MRASRSGRGTTGPTGPAGSARSAAPAASTPPSGLPGSTAASRRRSEPATLTYYVLLLSTLVLLTLGLIMVFSVQSVVVAATGGNAFTDFAKYLGFAVVGVIGMLAVSRVPLK